MLQPENFFKWIEPRIKTLISEKDADFSGEIYMLNDFREHKVNSDNYCVYQTEALHLGHKLTWEYKNFLDGAKNVYDYSINNLKYYPRAIYTPLKLNSLPPIKYSGSVVFYGHMTDRRAEILTTISQNNILVNITNGQYGKNLVNLLTQFKYVLSIGSYDNINNDSFRIIPAIENGCIVIAEKTHDEWFDDYLLKECPDRIIFTTRESIVEDLKNYIT
jgi:hypothetical protein